MRWGCWAGVGGLVFHVVLDAEGGSLVYLIKSSTGPRCILALLHVWVLDARLIRKLCYKREERLQRLRVWSGAKNCRV